MMLTFRRALLGVVALAVLVAGSWAIAGMRDLVQGEAGLTSLDLPPIPPAMARPAELAIADSFFGRSRALQFKTLTASEAFKVPGFLDSVGEQALRRTGVFSARHATGDSAFAYIVLRPFGDKKGEVLNGYRLGRWPSERWIMGRNYANPDGFVEVTPALESLRLSKHFTLGDFVTHDQRAVWPKYVVLDERLIDKLELLLQELARRGIPVGRVRVLSGFRAPYYNERGVGEGMARGSRHQFGDAADIIVDDNGDGRMDDLNRDGRLNLDDTIPISNAIGVVERRYPELLGGLGTYAATGPSGPFAHVDVRGTSARWGSGWWKR